MLAPAQAEAPRTLWEEIPAETELDADYGTVLWFVEPEAPISDALAPEVAALEVVTLEAMAQDETIDLATSDEMTLLSDPLIISLIEPEAMIEEAVAPIAPSSETWLPKVEAKPKKSLLRRMFGGR